tara:strand:- start:119 stop:589 length:471 start_codon:yes stop_codon:yes gene_type:complete
MNIIEFAETFPTEESFRVHMRTQRELECILCKKGKKENHYWLIAKWQWQCSSCGFRTGLRSGTMMEHSNLPVRTWYLAMAFMSFSKKGISAIELSRQLGKHKYDSVWKLMHKIRNAMGQRDSRYNLSGEVEFDEGYFEKATSTKVNLNVVEEAKGK